MQKESIIEVNGKMYTLQHPGNREWLKLKQEIFKVNANGTVTVDLVLLLDYGFEHVVFPEEGPKLNLDDMGIQDIEEVWGVVLQQFFRGKPILESYTAGKGKIKKETSDKSIQPGIVQEKG